MMVVNPPAMTCVLVESHNKIICSTGDHMIYVTWAVVSMSIQDSVCLSLSTTPLMTVNMSMLTPMHSHILTKRTSKARTSLWYYCRISSSG